MVRVTNDFMDPSFRACASADRGELRAKSLRAWRTPAGFTRYDVERDYKECEYKAGLANDQHFFSQSSPFPFGAGSQSPADHARALRGLLTINVMRDTCPAAKGYRVE